MVFATLTRSETRPPMRLSAPRYRGRGAWAVHQRRSVTPRAGDYTSHGSRRPAASGAAGIRARVRLHSAAWGLRRPQTPATFARAQHRGCRRNTLAAARSRPALIVMRGVFTRHTSPSSSQIARATSPSAPCPRFKEAPLHGALPLTRHSSLRDHWRFAPSRRFRGPTAPRPPPPAYGVLVARGATPLLAASRPRRFATPRTSRRGSAPLHGAHPGAATPRRLANAAALALRARHRPPAACLSHVSLRDPTRFARCCCAATRH